MGRAHGFSTGVNSVAVAVRDSAPTGAVSVAGEEPQAHPTVTVPTAFAVPKFSNTALNGNAAFDAPRGAAADTVPERAHAAIRRGRAASRSHAEEPPCSGGARQ